MCKWLYYTSSACLLQAEQQSGSLYNRYKAACEWWGLGLQQLDDVGQTLVEQFTRPQGSGAATPHTLEAALLLSLFRWSVPPGVFQAYKSYWPDGYMAHLAWAAAWMCKYDSSMCPTAESWFSKSLGNNNLRYGLGYDWDSTLPGVAALVIGMNLGVSAAAKDYLEGYILQKWEVSPLHAPAGQHTMFVLCDLKFFCIIVLCDLTCRLHSQCCCGRKGCNRHTSMC